MNVNRRYCRSCGTRLAADSTAIQCSPCQRQASEFALAPPEVPANFWSADIISDALASWHMGKVIHAYRHHPWHGQRSLPQGLVAGWLNLTQTQLSRIEGGPGPKDLNKLIKWAQILGIPESVLWFKLPSKDHSQPDGAFTTTRPATYTASPSIPSPVAAKIPTNLEGESDISVMEAFRLADRQVGGGIFTQPSSAT